MDHLVLREFPFAVATNNSKNTVGLKTHWLLPQAVWDQAALWSPLSCVCSHSRKSCTGGGGQRAFDFLLACDTCHIHILLAKTSGLARCTIIKLDSAFQGRRCTPCPTQHSGNPFPLASEGVRSAECCNSDQMRAGTRVLRNIRRCVHVVNILYWEHINLYVDTAVCARYLHGSLPLHTGWLHLTATTKCCYCTPFTATVHSAAFSLPQDSCTWILARKVWLS